MDKNKEIRRKGREHEKAGSSNACATTTVVDEEGRGINCTERSAREVASMGQDDRSGSLSLQYLREVLAG